MNESALAMLHPGWIFGIALVVLGGVTLVWRWPLPLGLLSAALLAALLAGFWVPFRHLVEGGFGYINLVLALFAGAFFGQAMRQSGAADALAARLHRLLGGRTWLLLLVAGVLLFLVGMFVGIAGVAVLAVGVFVAPLLRRAGLPGDRIAAFVAALATCGMIAPPLNVPAMVIADGVNMPYTGFAAPQLAVALPAALLTWAWFASLSRRHENSGPVAQGGRAAAVGFICLMLLLGFWTLLRVFPTVIPDPAVPLVLVLAAIPALLRFGRADFVQVMHATASGAPLFLAAVLVTVGVAVQIMTLTGVRGWLVINSMSLPPPWIFVELIAMPVFGGVLTSIGAANIFGVPFALALIGQDMILNVSALSAVAALAEFVPPTSIAAALATYVVGDTTLWRVLRQSAVPAIVIAALAIAMLIFADALARVLVTSAPAA